MFDEILDAKVVSKKVNMIRLARTIMKAAFEGDPDFMRGYVDNIAMRLYDLQMWRPDETLMDFKDKDTRDKVANEILRLIFW